MCFVIFMTLSCRREEMSPSPPRALVTKSLFAVFFVDGQKGWAAGKLGMIAATGDGGALWQAQKSITDNSLRGIYFLNDRGGWAVGDLGTLLYTEDGGKVWKAQQSATKHHLRDVFFHDSNKDFCTVETRNT